MASGRNISVYFDGDELDALDRLAKGASRSSVLRSLLRSEMERNTITKARRRRRG